MGNHNKKSNDNKRKPIRDSKKGSKKGGVNDNGEDGSKMRKSFQYQNNPSITVLTDEQPALTEEIETNDNKFSKGFAFH